MKAHVYLIGDIGYDEQLQPNGISDIAFIAQCEKAIRGGASSLEVHIDTNGGLVSSGSNITNYLKSCSVPVTTVNESKAYSIGSKIYLAGGYRKMKPNAKIMIHNNWADGIKGDADQVQAAADQLAATEKQLKKEYAELTGLSEDVIDGLMKSETYIGAEEAMSLGICNEVVNEDLILAKHKNKTEMSTATKKGFNLIEWASNLLKEKNMIVKLSDGTTELFIESETEDITGKRVFIAQDGVPTDKAPLDGEHTLSTGKVIVVSGGVISEVKEEVAAKPDENTETLKAEIEALKNALAAKDTEFNTLKETLSTTQSQVEQVNKQFVELAKSVKSDYVAPAATPEFGRTQPTGENKLSGFSKDAIKERENQLKNK